MTRLVDRAIVVTCLGHSGSTLLDLILGGHPKIIGLGEVFSATGWLSRRKSNPSDARCTCGQNAAECRFWGPVAQSIRSAPNPPPEVRYRPVLETFATVFGHDSIPVDISKNSKDRLRTINTIRSISPGTDIRAIHLIKDVRAFVVSRTDRDRAKHFPIRPMLVLFWQWYLENRRIRRQFVGAGVPLMTLGYDELCLAPMDSVRRITDFLGLEPHPSMSDISRTSSHALRGNRMRLDPKKNRQILYDPRWLYRNEWVLAAALSPHIMRYNAREVYGNLGKSRWENPEH